MNKLPLRVPLTFFVQNIAGNLAGPPLHQASARKQLIFSGTRHYRVGEIRRWLRGEWKPAQGEER